MRLNLGEMAVILGCGPDRVLRALPERGPEKEAPALESVIRAEDRRPCSNCNAEPLNADFWQSAAWGQFIPTGAGIDSRAITPGDLFFCLPGEKADGHDFAVDAVNNGACAVIALRNPFAGTNDAATGNAFPPVFLVDDVREALWRLAMSHRDTTLAKVVGITGTAGKTSVKEMLAAVLAGKGRTERNPMNLNNQIGLPLSMLNAHADAAFWVLELGISEEHDMDELGRILRPDIGVILNVGDGHTLGLGRCGVAACKARLLEYIQPGGVAVVSCDYPDLNNEVEQRREALSRKDIAQRRFSIAHADAWCRASYLGAGAAGTGSYRVCSPSGEWTFETVFRGDFGSENVAAIVTAALSLGVGHAEISHGLSTAKLPGQRFSFARYGDFCLLDDSYNANPLSSRRMIKAAAGMARDYNQPLFLVMGEMLELGDKADEAHRELGACMAEACPEAVFWKGGHAREVREGLRQRGFSGGFYPVGGGQDFSLLLEESDMTNALFLFKGSRSNHLERLVDIFRDKVAPSGENNAV